jgi:small conductance mechanosensitive channel
MTSVLEGIITRLESLLDPEFLSTQLVDWTVNLIVGMLVYAAFYLFWRLLRPFLRRLLRGSRRFDETAASFVETVVKYSLLTIGVINALSSADIDTSTVLASLGVAGLTIGFAARDALSNLISGILIFLDRPFVIDDLVEIEGQYGRVDRITLRSTRVITSDGKMLAVPNTEVINKTVASYTNFPHLRLDIPVTVAVHENLAQVRRLLLKTVKDNDDYLTEPPPRVVVTHLNDYNVAVELQAWLRNERLHVEKRSELRENVFDTLNQEGVDMPFETIQLMPLEVKKVNGSTS